MQRTEFIEAITRFIRQQNRDAVVDVAPHVNLFDAGLLESFKLPMLVAFLTDELALPVDLTSVGMEAFYTIDTMYQSFALASPAAPAR